MRTLAIGACAAVLAALAGCANNSSSTNPLLQHTYKGTLSCQSQFYSGHTLADDISSLATDDQAISGQWATAEAQITGSKGAPTAAQDQAITDLTATLSDLGNGAGGQSSLAVAVTALDKDGSKLTGGASDWRSAGARVSADIAALSKTCSATS